MIKDISSDPARLLTVPEFKQAMDSFWDVLSSDTEIQAVLDEANQLLPKQIAEAVIATKLEVYRHIFWDKVSRPDYDP